MVLEEVESVLDISGCRSQLLAEFGGGNSY